MRTPAANIFKIKRDAQGLHIKEVAAKLGVSATLVSMWEKGLAWPGPRLIPKLAKLFNMAPEAFARELEEARLAVSDKVPA